MYFANSNFLRDNIEELVALKGDGIRALIINAESINDIDSSAILAIEEILTDLNNKQIELFFSGVKGPVRDAMALGKLDEKIGEDNFLMCVQDAVDAFDHKNANSLEELQEYTSQSNVD